MYSLDLLLSRFIAAAPTPITTGMSVCATGSMCMPTAKANPTAASVAAMTATIFMFVHASFSFTLSQAFSSSGVFSPYRLSISASLILLAILSMFLIYCRTFLDILLFRDIIWI